MNSSPSFHLSLFGTPSLHRDGLPLSGRAAQRHRMALLALLAQAPSRRLTRDKLIALLWPERDPERGRNLLKVATYVLREALGDGALRSEGDQLALDVEALRPDTVAFEAAIERADHAAAVALYRGPFLDGFFLSDAPEFEQWVDRERQRLAGLQGRALEALAEGAEAARDLARAVAWWEARAAHDPFDSRVALRLVRALDEAGNRAGALQRADAHRQLLDEELGVAPPAELRALADRLRRHSLETPVPTPPAPMPPSPELAAPSPPITVAPPARPSGNRPAHVVPATRTGWWRTAAVLLAALFVVGAVWAGHSRAADPAASIAVLPFLDLSAAPDDEYFSDGLTDEIITRLAAVPSLKVISRTSAMHYKASAKPIRTIAGELNVAHVLQGSVRLHDGQVRISAQLLDTRTEKQLWTEVYEYPLDKGVGVQQEIAQEVVRALQLELGERVRALLVKRGTEDAEAYRLYARARYLWGTRSREGNAKAIEYFQRAIARDSGYSDAYAGLADAYLVAYQYDFLPEAEAAARNRWAAERALALDEGSAEAHTSFAIALWWQKNWPGAARELRRAIELNPGHRSARGWRSQLLVAMGQADEGVAESRRTLDLDPFSAASAQNYGRQCYVTRDFDCAIAQFRAAADLGNPAGLASLGVTLALRGAHEEALRVAARAVELAPGRSDFVADLAFVQARAGQRETALATLQRAREHPFEPLNVARVYIAMQVPDSAFAWLERSSWHWPHRALRGDPALDPVRSDPRFAQLSERIDRELGLR